MAAINEIHVNDAGLAFQVQVFDQAGSPLDLSLASTINLLFQKPDGTLATFPAGLTGDGTDGGVEYVSEAGDFDQAGGWRYQVFVEIGPDQIYSNITKFKVYPNLPLG